MSRPRKKKALPAHVQNDKPAQLVSQHQRFSGPIPPPAILEQYDRVLPGAAERILSMAEQNMQHEHTIDSEIVGIRRTEYKRGQVFGLIIAIVAITSATICAIYEHEGVAMVIGGATVVGLVSAFVYAQSGKSK